MGLIARDFKGESADLPVVLCFLVLVEVVWVVPGMLRPRGSFPGPDPSSLRFRGCGSEYRAQLEDILSWRRQVDDPDEGAGPFLPRLDHDRRGRTAKKRPRDALLVRK